MIQIDKGIPMPPPRRGHTLGSSYEWKYPWKRMEIGDSFVFPFPLAAASRTICERRKYDRAQYKARTMTEDGEKVVRIWRVA